MNPIALLKEAKTIAKAHGLFVVERASSNTQTVYIVYRAQPGGNVCIGARATPVALRRFIARAAGVSLTQTRRVK